MQRFERMTLPAQAVVWAVLSGLIFSGLNTMMRMLSIELHPFMAQFLRYLCGLAVMLPLVMRGGLAKYRPNGMAGQFGRGALHTGALILWFLALPHISIADTTAIGFTGPIFIMIGAAWLLGERMRWERWAAALIGFAGVLIVVGPKMTGTGGWYNLLMLGSAPMFAASFLMTKILTRRDRAEVIVVWQAITVTLFSLPLALVFWVWPTPTQWVWFLLCGVLGSAGHFCLTKSFSIADISTTQSVKFLDLVWATFLGFLVFGDRPSVATIVGGGVILGATIWIARRESKAVEKADLEPG